MYEVRMLMLLGYIWLMLALLCCDHGSERSGQHANQAFGRRLTICSTTPASWNVSHVDDLMYVFVLASRNRGADVDVGRSIDLLDGADVADGCGGVVAMPSMPEPCPALGEIGSVEQIDVPTDIDVCPAVSEGKDKHVQ